MAQFDLFQNPSKRNRDQFPYLVDIQHPFIDEIATRIVIPLGRLHFFRNESMTRLTPEVEYEGEQFILVTPQIASVPVSILKNKVGSLAHIRSEIIAALDFAITGI
jgi:toxin CcdB